MPSPAKPRICVVCGREWLTRNKGAQTCSQECRRARERGEFGGVPMPAPRAHPHVVNAAESLALELVGMVRDEDPAEVWRRIGRVAPQTLYATVIALAAMVDDQTPISELTAWLQIKPAAA